MSGTSEIEKQHYEFTSVDNRYGGYTIWDIKQIASIGSMCARGVVDRKTTNGLTCLYCRRLAGTVEAPGQLAVDSWVQILFDRMHEAYRANRCGVRKQMDA